MGMKAACIFVNEKGPGYFASKPVHRADKARQLIEQLKLGRFTKAEAAFFDGKDTLYLYPPSDRFVLGAYDGGIFLSYPQLINPDPSDRHQPVLAAILSAFPSSTIFYLQLHSVINHVGYALYEKGNLRRGFLGSEDVLKEDRGEWLPEEKPFFEHSEVRDGQRYFYEEINGEKEEYHACAFGETLAQEVARGVLGCEFPPALNAEIFFRPPWWKFW
jgi:hypothetical protein